MSSYVGVDWASRGWLAVSIDGDGDWTVGMHPSFHSVWFTYRDASEMLVDIPIGLPSNKRRRCDREAKAFLGTERGRSVFWTPCREAITADSFDAAKKANQRCRGDKISSQAWWLSPKIREVDEFLRDTPEAKEKVRESHPEVCFKSFSESDLAMDSKHEPLGLDGRKECLDVVEAGSAGQYDKIVSDRIKDYPEWSRRIGLSNRNDLLDAMVLAVTAKLGDGNYSRFPADFSEDDVDGEGLPMEIVYAVA